MTRTASKTYRPAVAWPVDLAQEDRHFASGVNHPGEVRGLSCHIGIAVTEIRTGLLEELALIAGGATELFVDTGAFSEVEFLAPVSALKGKALVKAAKRAAKSLGVPSPAGVGALRDLVRRARVQAGIDPNVGKLVVKKAITDKEWERRLSIMLHLAMTFRTRARIVAPDLVGDQDRTLARLETYKHHVRAIAAYRSQIIVPVQKGALPMSEMFRRACEILMLPEAPIAGIPMKKDATSLADLAELVDSLPWYGARIHLLGLGPESKRFAKVIRCIKSRRPNAEITSDSVTIRRLVGRTNGRGGTPRKLTKYQDDARALGLTTPFDIKSYGLGKVSMDSIEESIDRAHAQGWFDEELYDSLEEAIAHRAAGYPEEAPLPKRGQLTLALGAAA